MAWVAPRKRFEPGKSTERNHGHGSTRRKKNPVAIIPTLYRAIAEVLFYDSGGKMVDWARPCRVLHLNRPLLPPWLISLFFEMRHYCSAEGRSSTIYTDGLGPGKSYCADILTMNTLVRFLWVTCTFRAESFSSLLRTFTKSASLTLLYHFRLSSRW